jgi:hypothetical protein
MRRKQFYALGRLKSGEMNKLEAAYALELQRQLQAGEIQWWKFEAMTFKLADNTRYTPDFAVMRADNVMEFRETKGRWMDDAKVKIKVAAEAFPFPFVAIYKQPLKDGGGWRTEEF